MEHYSAIEKNEMYPFLNFWSILFKILNKTEQIENLEILAMS